MDEKQPEFPDARDDEALGLPTPREYDGPVTDAREYGTEKYAQARTLEEAIELRGALSFLENVTPEDFDTQLSPRLTKVGVADLFASSTWRAELNNREVAFERELADVKDGATLEVRPCTREENGYGYRFHTAKGTVLPYDPYHDYDDVFFTKALDALKRGERLLCQVESTTCYGENGIEKDPGFCWRIYDCRVTVYRLSAQVA